MKRSTQIILMASIGSIVWTGCVSNSNHLVPKTKITGDFQRGTFNIELPKDLTAEKIDVKKGEGEVSVEIQGIKVRTNPEVIGAAGQAQADALDIVGKNTVSAFEKGVEVGKKAVVP